MTSASDKKWRTFNCLFSVQGTGGSPTGPDPKNRVGDQDTGSTGRPVSSGLQVHGEPGHCRARTRCPWWTSRGVFPSKCPSLTPAEISNTPRWHFGLLEDNQWGGCRFVPKKSRWELFQRIFALGIFWGWVSRYAATPLMVALSQGHNDITMFHPWSPNAPDKQSFGWRRKNPKSCSDDWHRWSFRSAFRHFGTHFAESFRMSKSLWMMDPTHSCEMPSCSAIDLAEIRRSSKISSWSDK